MKKYILLISTIFLIVVFVFGCAKEKTYQIIIYKDKDYYEILNEDVQKSLKYLNEKYYVDKICYAKEIISYTDKSVRFIDKKDRELFISGDKIKIRQTE